MASIIGGAIDSVTNFAGNILADNPLSSLIAGGGNQRFPSDLSSYYISFQFMKYERRSIFDRTQFTSSGGITLPMPDNLMDANHVNWSPEEQSLAVGAGVEQLLHTGVSTSSSTSDIVGAVAGAVQSAGAGALVEGISSIAAKYTGLTAGNVLSLKGLAENPFLTMLFKSPAFKSHSFSWRLAPKSPSESNTLLGLITTFKANMLPSFQPGTGGIFLSYPMMVNIKLNPNQYLYNFKPAVITDVNVNYAPMGVPSFFKGTHAPTSIEFSINIMEIEYWMKEDYTGTSVSSFIGAPSPTVTTSQQIRGI